ncbi:MAG: PAS domain S-box protein [Magnetococcus sp. YQC-3]
MAPINRPEGSAGPLPSQSNEALYRELFDNLDIGVALYTTPDAGEHFFLQEINRAAERVDRLRKEEVLGQDVTRIFPGVEQCGLLAVFREVWRSGQPHQHPVSFYQDTRISGWREHHVCKLAADTLAVTYRDTKEQRRVEEGLRLYDAMLQHMTEGVALLRTDGTILYSNPRFAEMFAYEPGALVGQNIRIITAPTNKTPEETTREISTALTREEFWHGELLNITRNGTPLWNHATVSSLDHPYFGTVWVAIYQDISEHKRAELALLEEMYRRHILFEHSRDGLCVLTADGRVIEANNAFTTMLGYSPEEIKSLAIWDWDAQWNQEELRPMLEELGSAGRTFVTRHRRKDGSLYDVEISTCKAESQGRHLILASHRDITQQLRLDAQIKQAMKMEAIGTLAGGIAHDFNNILGVILGYTELVLKHLPEGGQPRLDLQEVYQAGLRARDLVAQLLTFSRQGEQESRPLLLAPLVKEVVRFLKAVIPNGIEVTLHLDTQSAQVMSNPTHIHQILMNLCTNAIQAMENETGRLTIRLTEIIPGKAADEPLQLSPVPHALLTVSDTGTGIPAEIQPRIFDPFFTTKGSGTGTGLGLSVVHGLVMSAGGAVDVQSRETSGAHFRVYLPLLQNGERQSDGE